MNSLLETIPCQRGEGEGRAHGVREWDIGEQRYIETMVATGGDLTVDNEVIARCARDDADRTADRVAPKERALWPFEDFHTLDIEQILIGAHGAREVDTIEIDPDSGVEIEGEVILPDAADGGREHRGGS